MKCEFASENIVLMKYGELPDELAGPLEQHLAECESCRGELEMMQRFDEQLDLLPVADPSPNLLAQSRMRLDDALDMIPPHGFLTRFRANFFRWIGNVQSAPALATLLVGVGFLAGNFTYRYQAMRQVRPSGPVVISHPTDGVVANVTSIEQIPNSELVQVHYNKVVPETMEASLDTPEIRQLLLIGTNPAAADAVRFSSVGLLTSECQAGHACQPTPDGKQILAGLMVSLRYDRNAGVRMKALEGLQRYVDQDSHVRDAVSEALLSDPDEGVRRVAIGMLGPVRSDSSVQQVLRTVSTQDTNPYIRTASYQALQDSANIQ
jgi:hypothetical protein